MVMSPLDLHGTVTCSCSEPFGLLVEYCRWPSLLFLCRAYLWLDKEEVQMWYNRRPPPDCACLSEAARPRRTGLRVGANSTRLSMRNRACAGTGQSLVR